MRLLAVALAAVFLNSTEVHAKLSATIAVTPTHPLMDDRLDISISGLLPNAQISIATKSLAQDGLWWRSQATFRSDSRGDATISRQIPLSGSYHAVDGMGLFWSMTPDAEPKRADHAFFAITDFTQPIETEIEARDADGVLASTTIQRRYSGPGIRAVRINDQIVGTLYEPSDPSVHPGVLVLGGSDPGFGSPGVAMLLASHGYSALSLAYFGTQNLPRTLENVPMEYFASAIRWMHGQPSIDPRFVAIYGESRGTEPALWTAAMNAGVDAVAARSPSFVLWGGVTSNHWPGRAAWTQGGKPLPYIANRISFSFAARYLWDIVTGTPVNQTTLFLDDLSNFGDTASVEIPVEKIRGPVMLVAGKDDRIWPSFVMASRIMARLGRYRHPYGDQLLAYENVGHAIPYAYLPTRGDRQEQKLAVGGTPEGTAMAQADAWPRVLQFLSSASARATRAH